MKPTVDEILAKHHATLYFAVQLSERRQPIGATPK